MGLREQGGSGSSPGTQAEHEFGRAAADVGDEERPAIWSGGQFRGRPGERQHRLLGPGEDLGRNAKHLLDQADEIGRVIGVPGGARRHHAHGLRTRTGDDVRVVAQHGDGPRERLRRQPPGLVYPLTEPDDLHPAGHVGQFGAARIYVGQQQPQRVGPAVHGGYPAESSGVSRDARPRQPPFPHGVKRLPAERVHAACGEFVSDERMQALYSLGHPPGRLQCRAAAARLPRFARLLPVARGNRGARIHNGDAERRRPASRSCPASPRRPPAC